MTNQPTLTSTQFKDTEGLIWDCKLNLGAAKRVTNSDFTLVAEIKVNMLTQPSQELVSELLLNKGLAMAVVWAIIQPQASAANDLTEDEFCEAIDGPVAEAATTALMEALADFFPEMRIFLSRSREMMKEVAKRLEGKLDQMRPEVLERMDQMMEEELQKTLTELNLTHGGK